MKVVVDMDVCDSTGTCTQVCPEVFAFSTDGFLNILQGEPPVDLYDKVAQAADMCPTAAIQLEY
ncbi:MAG TPA: ferredoxin [Propionibacteriaceae bacterium]|nr:ferredoxin [Propionibacteriaceae bacterium]